MNLPDVVEVKQRIIEVEDKEMRMALMALYTFAARVSEIVSVAYPYDTVARGMKGTDVKEEDFIGHDRACRAIVFKVATAKRGGKIRLIALPKDFDNWGIQLFEYFKSKENNPVFLFNRQKISRYVRVNKVFAKLRYPISTYKVWKDGQLVKKVEEHSRAFSLHALRHLRATELVQQYGFDGKDLASYCGWSLQSMGFPAMADVYLSLSWRSYFPKLLVGGN